MRKLRRGVEGQSAWQTSSFGNESLSKAVPLPSVLLFRVRSTSVMVKVYFQGDHCHDNSATAQHSPGQRRRLPRYLRQFDTDPRKRVGLFAGFWSPATRDNTGS